MDRAVGGVGDFEGHRHLDAALEALAAECRAIEPDARLRARIKQVAAERGLVGSADKGHDFSPRRDWWWFGARASGLIASLGLVVLFLWLPGRLALPLPVEIPLPGRAAVAPAPAVPQPGQTVTASAKAVASKEIGVRPSQHQAPAALKLPNRDAQPDLVQVSAGLEPNGLPSPAMQWPPEVLAAARQMARADRVLAEPDAAMVETQLDSVRVRMGADELWRMGLSPVPAARPHTVLADFLVSEEGRPLAVRLLGVYP